MESKLPLDEELAFFEKKLEEWLVLYPGRFVLVKESALVGVYDTESAALEIAAQLYGRGPYLIRRVLTTQPSNSNLAYCLGMISAAPR